MPMPSSPTPSTRIDLETAMLRMQWISQGPICVVPVALSSGRRARLVPRASRSLLIHQSTGPNLHGAYTILICITSTSEQYREPSSRYLQQPHSCLRSIRSPEMMLGLYLRKMRTARIRRHRDPASSHVCAEPTYSSMKLTLKEFHSVGLD